MVSFGQITWLFRCAHVELSSCRLRKPTTLTSGNSSETCATFPPGLGTGAAQAMECSMASEEKAAILRLGLT